MINLAIRLNDSFRRLKHAQKKPGKEIRNPSYKKKRDPDTINWQTNSAFKKKKSHKKTLNALIAENKDIIQGTAI
jgi:hypothetical protein